ncbi:MAG: hypothetical protein MRY32_00390 [Rickettsiales bacterium]|nr:hypothetical protein [Rickettsiales bacterium]
MNPHAFNQAPEALKNPALFYHNGLVLLEDLIKRQEEDEDDVPFLDLQENELEFYYRSIRAMMEDFNLAQAVAFAIATRTVSSKGIFKLSDTDTLDIQSIKSAISKSSRSRESFPILA